MKIESYSFGCLVVNGKTYTSDLILLPNGRVLSDWWRKEGHKLCVEDIKPYLDEDVKFVVVGTGAYGCMVVLDEVYDWVESMGLSLEVKPTAEAVKVYNRICDAGNTMGAFHLTC